MSARRERRIATAVELLAERVWRDPEPFVGAASPADDTLACRIARASHAADAEGRDGCFKPLMTSLLRGRRFALTPAMAALAEKMRTEQLGVTMTGVDRAELPAGLSWWEWDPRIDWRLPIPRGEVAVDRLGALVSADATGRTGVMSFVFSWTAEDGRSVTEVSPLAVAFDWRAVYEPPESMILGSVVEEARIDPLRRHGQTSPDLVSALLRRFGVVRCPFPAAEVRKRTGVEPGAAEDDGELLPELVEDAMSDALFVMAAAILVREGAASISNPSEGVIRALLQVKAGGPMISCGVVDAASSASPQRHAARRS